MPKCTWLLLLSKISKFCRGFVVECTDAGVKMGAFIKAPRSQLWPVDCSRALNISPHDSHMQGGPLLSATCRSNLWFSEIICSRPLPSRFDGRTTCDASDSARACCSCCDESLSRRTILTKQCLRLPAEESAGRSTACTEEAASFSINAGQLDSDCPLQSESLALPDACSVPGIASRREMPPGRSFLFLLWTLSMWVVLPAFDMNSLLQKSHFRRGFNETSSNSDGPVFGEPSTDDRVEDVCILWGCFREPNVTPEGEKNRPVDCVSLCANT